MTINATLCFHSAPRFATRTLAHVLDSLVRVSRRVDQHRSASITNPPHDGLVPQSNKTSAHRHRFPIPTCMLTTMTHTASPLRAWVNWFLGPRMHGRYIKVASEGHGDEAGLPSPFLNTRQPHTWSRCWLAIKTECIICFKIDTK